MATTTKNTPATTKETKTISPAEAFAAQYADLVSAAQRYFDSLDVDATAQGKKTLWQRDQLTTEERLAKQTVNKFAVLLFGRESKDLDDDEKATVHGVRASYRRDLAELNGLSGSLGGESLGGMTVVKRQTIKKDVFGAPTVEKLTLSGERSVSLAERKRFAAESASHWQKAFAAYEKQSK